ncbi:nuclear pore membrane glycoprotein 210 [Hetaerina americana]|uniref:nuclear pore membrane glycoprotein 210 n=1 Tax=Hetaerina americana TaxID=62018 RepID=UPI003A7F5BD0
MARIFLKCLYVLIAISWTITEGSKLNVPRVLLPLFTQLSTNFTLEVTEGGCYKWTTSRPDVVSLSPLDVDQRLGCSSVAVVRSASAQDGGTALTGRATAIVLAEEVHSGLVLRCDVIVDVIHSLSIVTTTRELFVEEAPEAFEVRAYDDQGNEFSTLEGVAFEWSIGGQKRERASGGGTEEAAGGSVLRFITYRDSPYEAPHGVELLESRGLRANTVLLEGMKTGSAKVSVRLPRQQGSAIRGGLPASVASAPSVPPVEVTLVVVANLLIDPPDIYVMPSCTIQYRVLQMKQGRLEEIPMPSEQYELELDQEDEGIAVINYATSVVTAKRVGRTRVTLRDRYVDAVVQEGGSARGIPTAHLKVGLPASLSLSVLPHRNWALTLGNEYELSVEVLDVGGRRLMVPHDGPLHAATKVPAAIFQLSGSTKNGTWHWGEASALGMAPVTASIDGPKEWVSSVAPARAEMRVFHPVKLIPSEVVLPCVNAVVEMQMRASGGDGNYVWTSSGGGGVVSVAQSGLLSVGPGECRLSSTAEVSVAMARNGNNRDVAKVWVLPMERLEITEKVIEAEVGATVPLNVAIYSVAVSNGRVREGVPFTDCKALPFSVRVWDEEKFEQVQGNQVYELSGNACNAIPMKSKMPGTTKVTVSSGKMDDTCIMVAYEPLKVVLPPSGVVVLAVGTSAVIRFEGGPRPLPGRPASEHVREIEFILPAEYDDDEEGYLVDAAELGEESEIAGGIHTYSVLCRKLGEGELRLTVFNSPSLGSKSSAAVTVVCSPPSTITLGIALQRESMHSSLARPCPIDPMAGRAVSHFLQDTNLEAVIMDPKGRKFDNVSSLVLEWHLSSYVLGQLKDNGLPGSDTLRVLHPNGKTGTLDISCKIAEYRRSHFRNIGLMPPQVSLDTETQATIVIVLVSEAVITPNHSMLFNHPSSSATLKVFDGSGHFELVKSAFEYADTHLVTESPKGGGLVKVSPKSPGTLHLSIMDLCLPGMAPATAEVQIFGIASIEAEVPDKVELGRSINASVRLIDTLGRVIPSPLPDPRNILGFKSTPASDLIGVTPAVIEKIERGKEGSLCFIVSGLALGDTTLTFSVDNPGTQVGSVVSSPMPIQVFPPLRLHPRSLVLVPGAVFQINYSGGPRPDPGIDFHMGTEFGGSSVAGVGTTGLVEALAVGSAMVWARASLTPQSASQESVEVRVVSLVGVRVKAPISRLCGGCTMPAWAEGVGQGARGGGRPIQVSPLILGSVRPGPEFSWNIVPHDILAVHGVFSAMGIEGREADRVSIRLHGLRPGRATIHLRVSLPALPSLWTAGGILEDSMEVEVFEEISLLLPPPPPFGVDHRFGRPLLMAPGATLHLRINKESIDGALVSYKLASAKEPAVVQLGPGGIVTSSSEFGRSVIVATYREHSGSQQSVVIAVEVKPIHYMMLTLKESGFGMLSGEREEVGAEDGLLPRGLPLHLRVSYHDDTGAMFSAAKRNLHFRTNRADLMRISHGEGNDTLNVDVIESGETMLKVWGEGGSTVEKEGENQMMVVPPVMDYVKLHVGEVILPAKPLLTVGDVICFHAAASVSQPAAMGNSRRAGGPWRVLPLSGVGGRSVSEGDILKLDEKSGVGKAVGPGLALVRLQLTVSGGMTSTEVDVRAIDSIVFLSSGGPGNLTNSHPEVPFQVPLVLLGPEDSALAKRSNVIPSPSEGWDREGDMEALCGIDVNTLRPYPFRCILQFSEQSHVPIGLQVGDIFTVHSGFDPVKGVYVCEIIPSLGSSMVQVSTLQVNFILRAVVINSHQSPSALPQPDQGGGGSSLLAPPMSLTSSQPLLLPFYPAIIVQPLSIQLSSGRPTANLLLTGSPAVLEQVEIQVCDESVLLVESTPSIPSAGLTVSSPSSPYSVHLKKAYWSSDELTRPLFITVLSEFTQQRIEVPVKVRLSEGDGNDALTQAPCIATHINSAGFSLMDFIFAHRNSFILAISTIVIILVTLYVYNTYIEPMVSRQQPVTMTFSPRQPPSHGSPLLRLSPTSSGESSYSHRHGSPYSEMSEPVYGAVSGSYYQAPSLRRNRKFL